MVGVGGCWKARFLVGGSVAPCRAATALDAVFLTDFFCEPVMSVPDSALCFLALGVVDFGEGLSSIIKLLICIDEDSADNRSVHLGMTLPLGLQLMAVLPGEITK